MKSTLFTTIKQLLSDRFMVLIISVLLLAGIAYAIYVGLALEPSDLQVATRYTSFGGTHFYRNKWYYLISFVIFGIITTGIHASIAVKLYAGEQRQLAIFVTMLSLFILFIAWITAHSVLGVAFL